MKTLHVVAALIENGDAVLSTQRGYGEFAGGWEFPGGKIEAGENPVDAIKREIQEELDLEIEVLDSIGTIEYTYPSFHLVMENFVCIPKGDAIHLQEHQDARWLKLDEMDSVDWLPADVEVVEKYRDYKQKQ